MSQREIDADRAAIAKATPGPWEEHEGLEHAVIIREDDGELEGLGSMYTLRDQAFVCEARTRWPAALDREQALLGLISRFVELSNAEPMYRLDGEDLVTSDYEHEREWRDKWNALRSECIQRLAAKPEGAT